MTSQEKPDEITRLLHAWQDGNRESQNELWPILYGELRNLAQGVLRRHAQGARHQASSLVHKAYLRLLNSDVEWSDRRHFFAVAARAMRFLLADEARRQLTRKRGAGATVSADDAAAQVPAPSSHRPDEVLAVHQALTKLAKAHPRHEKLVELRYFAGLSVEETAEALAVTTRTVVRDWKTVRVWLRGELRGTA